MSQNSKRDSRAVPVVPASRRSPTAQPRPDRDRDAAPTESAGSTSDLQTASLSNLAVKMTRLRKKLIDAGFDGNPLPVIRNEAYQLRLPVQLR